MFDTPKTTHQQLPDSLYPKDYLLCLLFKNLELNKIKKQNKTLLVLINSKIISGQKKALPVKKADDFKRVLGGRHSQNVFFY